MPWQPFDRVQARCGATILLPGTGGLLATPLLMAPGESSVLDAHYGRPRPTAPARKLSLRTAADQAFCALGPVVEQWVRPAAAIARHERGPAVLPAGCSAADLVSRRHLGALLAGS